jgi:hypothetical protein
VVRRLDHDQHPRSAWCRQSLVKQDSCHMQHCHLLAGVACCISTLATALDISHLDIVVSSCSCKVPIWVEVDRIHRLLGMPNDLKRFRLHGCLIQSVLYHISTRYCGGAWSILRHFKRETSC